MRTFFIAFLILSVASVGVAWGLKANAQSRGGKADWKDVPIGVVPTEYGDLAGFTGTTNNFALVFKSQEGEIRIVEFRGNRVNPKAFLIKRKY